MRGEPPGMEACTATAKYSFSTSLLLRSNSNARHEHLISVVPAVSKAATLHMKKEYKNEKFNMHEIQQRLQQMQKFSNLRSFEGLSNDSEEGIALSKQFQVS